MFKQKIVCYLIYGLWQLGSILTFTIYFLYFTDELGFSNAETLLLDTPLFLASMLFELPTGILADKYGYKKSFLLSIVCQIITYLLYVFSTNYELLLLGSAIFGIGLSFYSGAFEALCVNVFKKDLQTFFANRQIITGVVAIFVPVFSFSIGNLFSYRAVFLLALIIKIILLVLSFLFLKETRLKYPEVAAVGLELLLNKSAVIVRIILSKEFLRIQIFISLIWGFAGYVIDSYWSKITIASWNETYAGAVFALASVFSILGSVIAKRLKNLKLNYWLNFLLFSITVIICGGAIGSFIVIPIMIVKSYFFAVYESLYGVFLHNEIHQDRAAALSMLSLITTIGGIISTLLMGFAADKIGYGLTWVLIGLMLLTTSWLLKRQVTEVSD